MRGVNHISVDQKQLVAVCQDYGVLRLSVFGSALRDDFDPQQSDLDVLVQFRSGVNKSLFTLVKLQDKLSTLFDRQVDLTTPGSLSKYFRAKVLSQAEVLYDAA
jgi:predicted nucleotidyltransferase